MPDFDDLVRQAEADKEAAAAAEAAKTDSEAQQLAENERNIAAFLERMEQAGNPGIHTVKIIDEVAVHHGFGGKKVRYEKREVGTASGWALMDSGNSAVFTDGRIARCWESSISDSEGLNSSHVPFTSVTEIKVWDYDDTWNMGQYPPEPIAKWLAELCVRHGGQG